MRGPRGKGTCLSLLGLLGLLAACSGLDGPPDGARAAGGGAGLVLHAGGSCGASAGGLAGTGSSSAGLPGDFSPAGGASAAAGPGTSGTGGAAPGGHALVISEYVEGSSTYKALEVSALSDSSLDGCHVALYFNGSTTPTRTALLGPLAAGESHVLCSSALAELSSDCNQSAGLTFNGDDAIALECGGQLLDVMGQIGVDPGTAWGSGEHSLVDHTLRRVCGIASGDTEPDDAFEPALQWVGFPQDSFEDLGTWSCPAPAAGGGGGTAGSVSAGGAPAGGAGGTPAITPELATQLFFSEYVEGSSTYKALEISALEDSRLDGCRVAVYFNGATSASGTTLTGTLAAGETYVLCSSSLSELLGSCDRSAGLTFNGDDAIALECDGVVVDVIGQIGVDPGTAWGSGALSFADHTLRRACWVSAGDSDASDAFDPAIEWQSFEQDSFDDLGQRTCGGGGQGG